MCEYKSYIEKGKIHVGYSCLGRFHREDITIQGVTEECGCNREYKDVRNIWEKFFLGN